MQGGVVSGNTSQAYGGGIYAYSQTEFTMTGGTISGNKSTDKDKGVGAYIYNKFNISGGAKFDESNDVYLDGWSNKINITDTLSESKVATITPSAYTAGRQVLSAASGTITQDICGKFALTPAPDGTDWTIVSNDDGTAGVIALRTYTFKVEADGTEIVEDSTLSSVATITLSEVSRDGVALTASDGTFLIEMQDTSGISFSSAGIADASATGLPATIKMPPLPPVPTPLQVYVKVVLTSGKVIDKTIPIMVMP